MAVNSGLMKREILRNCFDEELKKLYGDDVSVEGQRKRYISALESFERLYGEKSVEIYSAPGRTEVGGNHTDHQNGKVLAAAVDLDAIAVVARRTDNLIRIKSEGYQSLEVDLKDIEPCEREIGTTNALVRGMANGMKKRGYQIGGFEAYITSDVLTGSGLSSSAAYEVLIGNILSGLYNQSEVDPITIAQIGQEAENQYFGKPCGLMDQMACSVGGLIFIDFAKAGNPVIKKVSVDFNRFGHSLCIVDTKGSHADLTDEYASIPKEMKKVAAYFGKELLCQIAREDFYRQIPSIRKACGDRAVLRAMHWFAENDRVDGQTEALEKGDFDEFKGLIKASGDSSYKYLQNVFAMKNVEEQSISLALALSDQVLRGKGASRVHGGGFAGTIQAFVPMDMVAEYKTYMEAVFGNGSCHVLRIRQDGGIRVM
ncbi:MAG: galactokinase [Lachnospiraceae bacterium]|nr:galactokinase [Lachnospiraceae bacterium]